MPDLPTGHDTGTAFDWWDGSRRVIGQEPFDVAVSLYTAAPGITQASAIAVAHIVPVMTAEDDVVTTTRLVDAWLRAALEPAALRAQFSLKSEMRAIIAVDGMANCPDLADEIDDHAMILTLDAHAIRIDLERLRTETVLCITAGSVGRTDDRTTIAEIILGDEGDGDGAETPVHVSPEHVPA